MLGQQSFEESCSDMAILAEAGYNGSLFCNSDEGFLEFILLDGMALMHTPDGSYKELQSKFELEEGSSWDYYELYRCLARDGFCGKLVEEVDLSPTPTIRLVYLVDGTTVSMDYCEEEGFCVYVNGDYIDESFFSKGGIRKWVRIIYC